MILLHTFNVLISILSAFSGTLHFSSFSSGSRWNPLAASSFWQPSPKEEHRQVGGLCGQTVTWVIVQHGGIEVWVMNVIGFSEKGCGFFFPDFVHRQSVSSEWLFSVWLSPLFLALLRKYNQVVQRYFVQYLAGYDSVLLNSLIQVPIQSRIIHKNSKCVLIK